VGHWAFDSDQEKKKVRVRSKTNEGLEKEDRYSFIVWLLLLFKKVGRCGGHAKTNNSYPA